MSVMNEFAVVAFVADVAESGSDRVIVPPKSFDDVTVLNPGKHGLYDEELREMYGFFCNSARYDMDEMADPSAGADLVFYAVKGFKVSRSFLVTENLAEGMRRTRVAAAIGDRELYELYKMFVSMKMSVDASDRVEAGYATRLDRVFQRAIEDRDEGYIYNEYFCRAFEPMSLLPGRSNV